MCRLNGSVIMRSAALLHESDIGLLTLKFSVRVIRLSYVLELPPYNDFSESCNRARSAITK